MKRHLSKAQRAMATAFAFPDPEKGGRGNKGKASETDGFSATRLKMARLVLREDKALAQRVLAGDVSRFTADDRAVEADGLHPLFEFRHLMRCSTPSARRPQPQLFCSCPPGVSAGTLAR